MALTEKKLTIAVAESCTGGLITNRLTDVSGSSDYLERGLVTYSNAAKISMLGVPAEIIEKHGAVSEETARLMAEGVRKLAGTDLGLSSTGIAGPTGGSKEKPVGTVYIALADSQTDDLPPLLIPLGSQKKQRCVFRSGADFAEKLFTGKRLAYDQYRKKYPRLSGH